ncbi:TPA: prefoldin subunit alpha [Candidatus Woesearchaeota archaeon]|nr:prefoldin subunit alpha [Candidatus Woesearchaeota archaeon]HII69521.1 prefoldin subunit alpha [Candidatus Woesearchaeota archaeon]
MMKEAPKEFEQHYAALGILSQEAEQWQQQIEAVDEQLAELRLTSQSIKELSGVREGTDILVPVSKGIFVKAQVKDTHDLIVNVGAGIVLNKSPEETSKLLSGQLKEIAFIREQMVARLEETSQKASILRQHIKSASIGKKTVQNEG